MFKKILIPLDGSALSETALPVAAHLVGGANADVTLFRAGDAPSATRVRRKGLRRSVPISPTGSVAQAGVIPASAPEFVETKDQAVERRDRELLQYLACAAEALATTGCTVHASVHFGDAAEEILALAEAGHFDVIVMATHGRSGLRETLQGSVTAAVIRSGVAPVLVVKPDQTGGTK